MHDRILLRLALVAFAVAAIFGISRGATAVEQQITPRSYLPLISNAPMAVAWDLAGNAGTNPLLHFLGTTDGKPLIIQPAGGNVGIGTTAPGAGLEINKGATNDVALLLQSSGPGWGSGLRFRNTTANAKTYGIYSAADGKWIFADLEANTHRLAIDRTGNVGIGTQSPAQKLTVQTAANQPGITHTDGTVTVGTSVATGLGRIGTLSNHPLGFVTNNGSTASMTIGTNGNVGIGTTSPSNKLTVQTQASDGLGFVVTDGTVSLGIGVGDDLAVIGTSHPLTLFSGDIANGMTLTPNGRVGIGRQPSTSTVLAVNVSAASPSDDGIEGSSGTGRGVIGSSGTGPGVLGGSGTGPGVRGGSGTGPGVEGFSQAGTGVTAEVQGANPGIAIQVNTGDFMTGLSLNPLNPGQRFHITNNGTYVTGSDFAEALPARSIKDTYSPGDVLVLSTDAPGGVERASEPYDVRVAGVYSTRPGVLGADKDGETRVDINDVPVALVGVVPTKVSAENGPIQVGDQLTTSATPGHAMRCADRTLCLGAVIGKAMEPMADGTGVIKVLVTLR